MRKLATIVTLVAAYANGLVNHDDRRRGRSHTSQEESMYPVDSSVGTSRRDLLQGSVAWSIAAAVATTGSPSAIAAEFQVFNVSKSASGPNKPRIGGLAKKIQNSCRIMVGSTLMAAFYVGSPRYYKRK